MSGQGKSTGGAIWRIAAAASIGTFFDYYDVFLAASAASLVWPAVFFSGLGASAAIGLSLGAFGLNFVVRPLGAAIFGHYGDKLGRKRVVVWTLLVSALGTIGIAALPSSALIGWYAPFLLYVFRLVYGLGLGGEWGGAVSWVVEAAPESRRRGFLTGLIQTAAPLAGVVSSLSFAVVLLLPHAEFLAWGWRVLFALGSAIALVGFVIRKKLSETPMFLELLETRRASRSPVAESVGRFGRRIAEAIGAILYLFTFFAFFSVPYALTFMIAKGIPVATSNLLFTGSLAVGALACFAGSVLSDRFGRKKVVELSAILGVVMTYPWIVLVGSGNSMEALVGLTLMTSVLEIGNGAIGALLAESFPTSSRYTSSGIAYSVAGTLGGLFSGFFLPLLIGGFGVAGAIVPGAVTCAVVGAASLMLLALMEETKSVGLALDADPLLQEPAKPASN